MDDPPSCHRTRGRLARSSCGSLSQKQGCYSVSDAAACCGGVLISSGNVYASFGTVQPISPHNRIKQYPLNELHHRRPFAPIPHGADVSPVGDACHGLAWAVSCTRSTGDPFASCRRSLILTTRRRSSLTADISLSTLGGKK